MWNSNLWKFPILLFLIVGHKASACDACGCGPGAAFLQAMPQFGRQSIDLSSSLRWGRSEILPSLVVRYQHPFKGEWAVWTQVPLTGAYYRGYWSDGSSSEHILGGAGDPSIGIMRRIKLPTGQLQVGTWLGLPLGAYSIRSKQGTLHPASYQPGNGALSEGIWANVWIGTTERAWLLSAQSTYSATNRFGVKHPSNASFQALRVFGRETEKNAVRRAFGLSINWTGSEPHTNSVTPTANTQISGVFIKQHIGINGMITAQLQGVLFQTGDPRFRQWVGMSFQVLSFLRKKPTA